MPWTLFWLVYTYGTWVADRKYQNSHIRHWNVDISRNASTRLVSRHRTCRWPVPAARRWQTVCFTSASFVDRFPVRCCSRNVRIWKSLVRDGGYRKVGPYRRNQSDIRFAWPNGIRSFRPIRKHWAGKQFWTCTLKWNKLSPPRGTFYMRRDTSLGVIIGQVLTGKCQWWLRGGLMSTICYPSAIYTWISEYILRHYVLISMYLSWFFYTIIYFCS